MSTKSAEGKAEVRQDTELWTIEECAGWLKFSPEAVRCKLKRGWFPGDTYVYVGRRVRFLVDKLKEWVLSNAA